MLITAMESIASSLKQHAIIPDVVDEFVPEALLDITYDGKKVELGNKFTMAETNKAPKVNFAHSGSETDNKSRFTLMMVDPDAPSRKKPDCREWRHWVVGNIPSDGNLSEATNLDSYQGPSPPPGSGHHRYVFLLYRQQDLHVYPQLDNEKRNNFKARQFAEQYGLKLISANFFECECV
ncbi:protein D2-like isoform X1 [Gigaspora margarita]|uniref:Protein D2-like isoform X1 n=1 Tax=Gigaspora margarita TaxID=4874 RepID=A0A8H4AJU0_GIGMA|nr:protein D2-like isoform X1 [Gigaspora margarita]